MYLGKYTVTVSSIIEMAVTTLTFTAVLLLMITL